MVSSFASIAPPCIGVSASTSASLGISISLLIPKFLILSLFMNLLQANSMHVWKRSSFDHLRSGIMDNLCNCSDLCGSGRALELKLVWKMQDYWFRGGFLCVLGFDFGWDIFYSTSVPLNQCSLNGNLQWFGALGYIIQYIEVSDSLLCKWLGGSILCLVKIFKFLLI